MKPNKYEVISTKGTEVKDALMEIEELEAIVATRILPNHNETFVAE
jgi:hypothetical protein